MEKEIEWIKKKIDKEVPIEEIRVQYITVFGNLTGFDKYLDKALMYEQPKEVKEDKKEVEQEDWICEYYKTQEEIKAKVKECEGNHIQQVAYSSYHDTLTQVCFTCEKIRTNLKRL